MSQHTNIVAAPSGTYKFGQPTRKLAWEQNSTIVQVLEVIPGTDDLSGTPGRYAVETIADSDEGYRLAIDLGAKWFLSVEDTDAFIDYARGVMNAQLARA